MRNPTYRDLRDAINKLPEDHLDDNITVYVHHEDEWYGIVEIKIEDEDNVIDKGCLYLKTLYDEDMSKDNDRTNPTW